MLFLDSLKDFIPFFVVSLFWGCTNPLIQNSVIQQKDYQPFDFSLKGILNIIKRKSFIIAFGINQIGSIFYAYLLGIYPQHFSSISANSSTTVITFITQSIIKKKKTNFKKLTGISCVIIGIILIL